MSSGNNLVNLVAGNSTGTGTGTPFGSGGGGDNSLSGTFGAFLWQGFQSGAKLRPSNPPPNQFM
jgi:hypothetical protein